MSTVIKVENLSKQYRLGKIGTGTLSHDLNRWWHKVRGKEDPYLKVGQVNDRTQRGGTDDYVWALKDVSFEVKQGEVLGVIGKNGAGKSTLLKILSRTTLPTTGSVKVKGRIASLLEVGTGFHPELTGRENIFLNGAILGMRKAEIKSKFDEIVDFAGVDKYVDTPVKRYSSGMYVRLAFAVAAYLDPEILVVDEVLAVGDAEFQAKALGKMKKVSSQDGRTVIFVSHNMGVISGLCDKTIVFANGKIKFEGDVSQGIASYFLNASNNLIRENNWIKTDDFERSIDILEVLVLTPNENPLVPFDSGFEVLVKVHSKTTEVDWLIVIKIKDEQGNIIFTSWDKDFLGKKGRKEGTNELKCIIPGYFLRPGKYYLTVSTYIENSQVIQYLEDALSFTISEEGYHFNKNRPGFVLPLFKWKHE